MRFVVAVAVLSLVASACADAPVGTSGVRSARDAAPSSDFGAGGPAHGPEISILDACDPADPGWAPTGGCTLAKGDVSLAEFQALTGTPLVMAGQRALVGHPAWRNDPSYLSVSPGTSLRVRNDGGRGHTFTRVAEFGGGRVPPLNGNLIAAPECLLAPGASDPTEVLPGDRMRLEELPAGLHKFQCCIHPWMRAVVRVGA